MSPKEIGGNYSSMELKKLTRLRGDKGIELTGDHHLNLIGAKGHGIFFDQDIFAGKFLPNNEMNKDGSIIDVFENYQRCAERYAQLYEAISGKEVQINLVERLTFEKDGMTRLK